MVLLRYSDRLDIAASHMILQSDERWKANTPTTKRQLVLLVHCCQYVGMSDMLVKIAEGSYTLPL
jgi:hypothetical protein